MSKRKITWGAWAVDQVTWQARAAVFGAIFILSIAGTAAVWETAWPVARYDALALLGVAALTIMFALGAHSTSDALPIGLVFALGVVLELYKIETGAWMYPEGSELAIGQKPLFVGFMYAAVASYLIRALRVKALEIRGMPPLFVAVLVGGLVYGAYFLPSQIWVRFGLIGLVTLVFWRATLRAPSGSWLPLPVALGLAASLIWVAENIGTFSGTWAYPNDGALGLVTLSKLGAWYLLLSVCFIVVFESRRCATRRWVHTNDA